MRPSAATAGKLSTRTSRPSAGAALASFSNSPRSRIPEDRFAKRSATARAGASSSGFLTRTTTCVVRAVGGRSSSVQRSAVSLATSSSVGGLAARARSATVSRNRPSVRRARRHGDERRGQRDPSSLPAQQGVGDRAIERRARDDALRANDLPTVRSRDLEVVHASDHALR